MIQGHNVAGSVFGPGIWTWIGRYVVDGPGSKIDDVSQQAGIQSSVLYG